MLNRLEIRITKEERLELNKLAKAYNLSASEYVKLKIFEHNTDYVDQDIKFITPQKAKHSYFLALSQVKLFLTFQRLFEKQGLMKVEEFKSFDKEITELGREMINKVGYKRIESSNE
jgi:hypothetical protein